MPRAHDPRAQDPGPGREHGAHTLRVWRGTVVGVHGDDVFVELGPRMQGVISRRELEREPVLGEELPFTLRGREEDLWVLAPCPDGVLASWESTERGSLVQARVVRRNEGGFETKVGALHAFLPLSHSGVPRGEDPGVLLGKTLTCEVLEVDPERQRIVLSRKLVLRRERLSERQREVGDLQLGEVVAGRVSRIEDYGAFVRFGRGLEGLVHVSNLSHERVAHPGDLLRKGQHVEARVLSIRSQGKRISLGIKQLAESPWKRFEREHGPGAILLGTVTRLFDFGALVRVTEGVEGLLHRSELDLAGGRHPRQVLARGQELAVRVVDVDVLRERMSLSRLHESGAPVAEEEVEAPGGGDRAADAASGAPLGTSLGDLLRGALRRGESG